MDILMHKNNKLIQSVLFLLTLTFLSVASAENDKTPAGKARQRILLLEGVRRGFWSHGRSPRERAELYRNMRLRVTSDAEGKGMRLEFAYVGEEGFCEPNNPSWNTPSGTSWQWRQRAS